MDTTLKTIGTATGALGSRAVTVAISDPKLTFDRRGRDCGSRLFRL
jgi:hypothetical protein